MNNRLAALALASLLLAGCNRPEPASTAPSLPSPTDEKSPGAASVTPSSTPMHCPDISKSESRRALKRLPSGWTRLTPPPVKTARAISLWTGAALFYWGGDSVYGGVVHNDGALYEPAADKWHRLPPPPIEARSSAAAVWTGREVIIWGGQGDAGEALEDGAAFDPTTCRWRKLAPSPLDARSPFAAVWTGREAIFWGSFARPRGAADGAAYHPVRDRWRRISNSPLRINTGSGIWTGHEMILLGSRLDNNNRAATDHAVGTAYNLDSDRWRRLPPVELSPQASAIAWTGSYMIAWDYELTAFAYNAGDDEWRDIDDVPIEFSECYPTNAISRKHLLAYFCGAAALFDLRSERWREIRAPLLFGRPTAAESVFLFAGAAHETNRNRLMAYNPS